VLSRPGAKKRSWFRSDENESFRKQLEKSLLRRYLQANSPEANMPTLLEEPPRVQERPDPLSHDCSHEHSLDHWLEVYWMVEEDCLFSGDIEDEPQADSIHAKQPVRSAGHHHRSALRR
jgi:hypothetical protein